MASTADKLFEYLRDLLYDPERAQLDVDTLDEEYKQVGMGLLFFGQSINQQRELADSLSKGNLSVKLPPPDNQLAAPLKALHASLKHLTWTSQQVAKGDYQQRLDFMGEFAEAFNTMTVQLEQRQRALEDEIEKGRKKTLALQQSISLLEAVTDEMQQWIVVMDAEGGKTLFQNRQMSEALEEHAGLDDLLRERLYGAQPEEAQQREIEITLASEQQERYFRVASYPVHWKDNRAVAHVISDISDEKRQMLQLENYAYQDNLTGIGNRYYGMQTLRDWLEEGKPFSLSFVDLDNLKFVNDNFGHSEGDLYIISAAQILANRIENGMVCRLGGDEFMILAPETNNAGLAAAMDAAREDLISEGKAAQKPYLCSLSYGVVEAQPGADISSGALLSQADERMYEFKRRHKMGRGKTLV